MSRDKMSDEWRRGVSRRGPEPRVKCLVPRDGTLIAASPCGSVCVCVNFVFHYVAQAAGWTRDDRLAAVH